MRELNVAEKMTSKEAFPLLAKMFGIDETMVRAVTITVRSGEAVVLTVERFTESQKPQEPEEESDE